MQGEVFYCIICTEGLHFSAFHYYEQYMYIHVFRPYHVSCT